MLARRIQSAYVCLRCQKNLFSNSLDPANFAGLATRRVPRRWQSAATSRVEDDEADDHRDALDTLRENDSSSPTPQKRLRQANRDHPKFRKWKPKSTAELGVDSLGKPAEVLLLPSRNRKITQAPKTDEEKEAGGRTSVHESLDREKAPLSGLKLAENIEQVRLAVGKAIGKLRGQLENSEWKAVKSQLDSGFKAAQLKIYIKRKNHGSLPKFKRPPIKPILVRYVAEELWGYTLPGREEVPRSSERPDRKEKGQGGKQTLSWSTKDPEIFDHLLTHPSQPLRTIAENFGVQIDAHVAQSTLRITGPAQETEQAFEEVDRRAKEPCEIHVPLQGSLQLFRRSKQQTPYVDAFLNGLQHKYPGLRIFRQARQINIRHLNQDVLADQARREILLSVPPTDDLMKSIIWAPLDKPEISLQPFPAPAEIPALLREHEWRRQVSTGAGPQTPNDKAHVGTFNAILQRFHREFGPAPDISQAESSRQDPYYDITASLGRALVQGPPKSLDEQGPTKRTEKIKAQGKSNNGPEAVANLDTASENWGLTDAANYPLPIPEPLDAVTNKDTEERKSVSPINQSIFVGGAPFAAQHLAGMESWTPQLPSHDLDITGNPRAILRLELAPVLTGKSLRQPVFEIFLYAIGGEESGKSRLRVARVSAVHDEKNFAVLCPQNDIDVKFTRQLKQDLAYSKIWYADDFRPTRNALYSYINSAQSTSGSDWVFLPLVSLPEFKCSTDVPTLGRRAAGQPPQDQGKEEEQEQEQEQETGKQPERARNTQKKVEYVLRTVDVVDASSHFAHAGGGEAGSEKGHFPSGTPFCLDHVSYTGADITRQELRLAQTPLFGAPVLRFPSVPHFVSAALNLVLRFSGKPTSAYHGYSFFADSEGGREVNTTDGSTDATSSKAERKVKAKPQRKRAKRAVKMAQRTQDRAKVAPNTSPSTSSEGSGQIEVDKGVRSSPRDQRDLAAKEQRLKAQELAHPEKTRPAKQQAARKLPAANAPLKRPTAAVAKKKSAGSVASKGATDASMEDIKDLRPHVTEQAMNVRNAQRKLERAQAQWQAEAEAEFK